MVPGPYGGGQAADKDRGVDITARSLPRRLAIAW